MVDIRKDNIRVRTLTKEDLPFMLKWLTDDRVLEYYGGRDQKYTLEKIRQEYIEEDVDISTRLIMFLNIFDES